MPSGKRVFNSFILAYTPAAVSSAFEPGSVKIDSATDCWPSRVHDWLYCCEPNSTLGLRVFGSTVTTSLRRTMPVAVGAGPVRFDWPIRAATADCPLVPAAAAPLDIA